MSTVAIPVPNLPIGHRRGWQLPAYAESTAGNVALLGHQWGCPMRRVEGDFCADCDAILILYPKGYSGRPAPVIVIPQAGDEEYREGPPTSSFRTALLVALAIAPQATPLPPNRPNVAGLSADLRMVQRLIQYGRTWTAADATREIGASALSEAEEHVARALDALKRADRRGA